MRARRLLARGVLAGVVVAAAVSSCSSPFPKSIANRHIVFTTQSGSLGAPDARLPINFDPSNPVLFRIEMHRSDGSLDDGFNSYVHLVAKPGSVYTTGNPVSRFDVKLTNGVADQVPVSIIAGYGDVRIWAQDLGYEPVDAKRDPPPACSDGIDNDGDGVTDYPADPGCFSAVDDTEDAGSGAAGASDVIYYARPRIADVRGVSTSGGQATPFPKEQLDIDTGYDDATNTFAFDTVVTRIASTGFYVTDVQDQQARGYASVFAYTFSSPSKIGVCDRLRLLQGTASDFYGFTELGFPTWSVEYYNPAVRPCLVPDPFLLTIGDLNDATHANYFKYESGLVRLLADGNAGITIHVGKNFGPGKPVGPSFSPTADATNCDLDGSGKIDFADPSEGTCAKNCENDVECTEFSGFLSQGDFSVVMSDGSTSGKAQLNASAATSFDPVEHKGQDIKAFTGTVRYFSGGGQFTIEARCDDDIIVDPNGTPLTSDKACVRANGTDPNRQ